MGDCDNQLYALFHKMIRNDYHCPVCCQYYVTIYDNLEDLYLAMAHLDEEDLTTLKLTSEVWVDEWVRRSNGDLYKVASGGVR